MNAIKRFRAVNVIQRVLALFLALMVPLVLMVHRNQTGQLNIGTILNGALGGLLGNALGGQQGQDQSQMSFKTFLKISNGDAAYDTAAEVIALLGAAAAGFSKIWEMSVPAQQQMRWGFGNPAYPHNQGYMWFAIADATTDLCSGILRLVQANARETKVFTVVEIDDSRLHTSTVTTIATLTPTSIDDMIALPEKVQFPRVGEDSLLQLHYSVIARATTEDIAEFSIPATVYQ